MTPTAQHNQALWYRHFGAPEHTLRLEQTPLPPATDDTLRVRMLYAPINASDLIPITGAYGHRISPPLVAGYEGIGRVISAPQSHRHLVGERVLPLRGQGTWQSVVTCAPGQAIPVPETIDTRLAARGYINPLAAALMLRQHPPAGKHVLLTAAGSDCAMLLGQWALQHGARSVTGIHRSAVHAGRLTGCGIRPLIQHDTAGIVRAARTADLVFDATGGDLAQAILAQLPPAAVFICYGLLSGKPFRQLHPLPRICWFHIRNTLATLSDPQWQALFTGIWPQLAASHLSNSQPFALADWQQAIRYYYQTGRQERPLLVFAAK